MPVTPHAFHLPRLGAVVRHALPSVVEGTLIPLATFYVGLQLLGPTGAILAALVWAYGALAFRLGTRRKVSGLLLISALAITVRSAISLATGSVFIYFLQPTVGTVAVACAFLLSVRTSQPLAERLAHDLVPLPEAWLGHGWLRRFFERVTLLWAFTFLANAVVSLYFLLTESIGIFLLARTVTSATFTVAAIAVSVTLFLRVARTNGARVVRAGRA